MKIDNNPNGKQFESIQENKLKSYMKTDYHHV